MNIPIIIASIAYFYVVIRLYQQWIAGRIVKYNEEYGIGLGAIKMWRCLAQGLILSIIFSSIFAWFTHFTAMVGATIFGVCLTWIVSEVWERFIDKSEDLHDTTMRLSTALIPFVLMFINNAIAEI